MKVDEAKSWLIFKIWLIIGDVNPKWIKIEAPARATLT